MISKKKQESRDAERIEQMAPLIAQGMSEAAACDSIGLSTSTWTHTKRRAGIRGFSELVSQHGVDPSHAHSAWIKTKEASVYIRNPKDDFSVEKFTEELKVVLKDYKPKQTKLKHDKITEGHLLLVSLADIHMGKLAIWDEATADYNMDIATQRTKDGVAGLLQKASGFPIDKIVLIIGNDILHIDSPKRQTTSGTPQDTDGQWTQAYTRAFALYLSVVDLLRPLAPLHIVHNPSNHDYMSGYMLAHSLSAWYHDSEITFDINQQHRKYFQYGQSLIGTTHGDGAKERDLAKLMASESRDLWAQTRFGYWYCHHLHHKIANEDIGVCIEYLRSPTSPDRWHSDNGFISAPALEAFVHSKENGQIARLTHYV